MRVRDADDCVYSKTVRLNTKNVTLAGTKGTNSHTANLEKEIFHKKKQRVQFTSEQATTEKLQRKYINICLDNVKIKFQIDTGSDLTIINADSLKKIKCPTLSNLKKIARGVTGEKLKFTGETFINVFFNGNERKLKASVLRNPKFFWNGLNGRIRSIYYLKYFLL